MDGNGKRWGSMLKRNNQLRSRVVTWKLMLLQLTDRQARPVPGLIAALQLLQQFLERDLFHSFALEEDGLYADTEDLQRRLVLQLRREHTALRRHLEEIDSKLRDGTVLADAQAVRHSALEFAQALRAHMQRDEQELIPLAEGRYRTAVP
jgi:hypothetical protein